MTRFLIIITVASFSLSFIKNNRTPCEMSFNQINDSTYILVNHMDTFDISSQTLFGNPKILISNDTVVVSGTNYKTIIVAVEMNCIKHIEVTN